MGICDTCKDNCAKQGRKVAWVTCEADSDLGAIFAPKSQKSFISFGSDPGFLANSLETESCVVSP